MKLKDNQNIKCISLVNNCLKVNDELRYEIYTSKGNNTENHFSPSEKISFYI